ncbi:hypothetical protein G4L39_04740 [Limisphaera ngatamarikiensis]|uniref:Uncharacterized protein n=1 Tax=Limisphaera ngatamarikiensis TaxID=1324935 RepID=A0A6M1RTJ0_9BACT|nr:hypothetical protein [Limisphaera ngatamarikiensis]NGO38701.1 hypothetical protein [Limisphaera ngatamarikiensis]
MLLGRLLVATGVVKRIPEKGGYRVREDLPWPAFSAGAVLRVRSGVSGSGTAAVAVGARSGAVACGGGERASSGVGGLIGGTRAEAAPGAERTGRVRSGRGGRWDWRFWRRWRGRGAAAAVRQMELPLSREEALSQVRVVRNVFLDGEGEGRVRRGGWLRRVRRVLDGLALRLAGGG